MGFLKALIATLAIGLTSQSAFAHLNVEGCARAAEEAAYKDWYKADAWYTGSIMAGGTDVIWIRGNVISYQVSVVNRKLHSKNLNWANYSVRVRDTGSSCKVIKVRKF